MDIHSRPISCFLPLVGFHAARAALLRWFVSGHSLRRRPAPVSAYLLIWERQAVGARSYIRGMRAHPDFFSIPCALHRRERAENKDKRHAGFTASGSGASGICSCDRIGGRLEHRGLSGAGR
jgi:hypothetical protein